MIEIVYEDEKKSPKGNEAYFQIPKNIRQMGQVDETYKIYIEDYAYHYLDRITEDACEGSIALLTGQVNWKEGVTYLFIRGAFSMEEAEVEPDHIAFGERAWEKAGAILEAQFPWQEIVGWFYTIPERGLELNETMERVHMEYFAGNDKVLYVKAGADKEEAFYRYENGRIRKQQGFYLYYEKNDPMQEYLIHQNQNAPMEKPVPDQAVKNFREIISEKRISTEKKEHKEEDGKEKNSMHTFMYASTAAALILALTVGSGFLKDYEKMGETQETAEKTSTRVVSSVTPSPLVTKAPTVEITQEAQNTIRLTPKPKETEIPEKPKQVDTSSEKTEKEKKKTSDAKTTSGKVGNQTYVIQPGDTLTSICRGAYGTTDMVDAVCEKNKISPETTIYPGETILLP